MCAVRISWERETAAPASAGTEAANRGCTAKPRDLCYLRQMSCKNENFSGPCGPEIKQRLSCQESRNTGAKTCRILPCRRAGVPRGIAVGWGSARGWEKVCVLAGTEGETHVADTAALAGGKEALFYQVGLDRWAVWRRGWGGRQETSLAYC